MKTIPLFKVNISEKVPKKLKKVLTSGFIGQGKQVEKFEKKLRKLWNTDNILTVNSGTSALSLAYHLIGLKEGDEVISTPVTCLATNAPLVNLGCKIVWADVDPITGLIDTNDVKNKITINTKAIITVDWGGKSCNYKALRKLNIPIVQDAAHSFLTKHNKKHITNTGGDFIAFSFQAIKHLTSIDGGVLKVPAEYYKRAKLLRWYGFDRESSSSFRCSQDVAECGFKYHMNDVNAIVGRTNITNAMASVILSRLNAKCFNDHIINKKLTLIPFDKDSSYWLYTLHCNDRDNLMAYLKANGIASSLVHNRNDHYTVMKDFRDDDLPGVDSFQKTHLCIPCGFWLSEKDVIHIVNTLNDW